MTAEQRISPGMLRILVVDDQPSQRDGRVGWLSGEPGVTARGVTFEQAAALGPAWADVDIAVLDGHDRRSRHRRELAATQAGVDPLAPEDRFIGVRIAALIRQHCSHQQTTIIMISAHARDNDLRARRIAQAGVDYVFEHYEVDEDAETFTCAVLSPQDFIAGRPPPPQIHPVDWAAQGYEAEPDVAGAIEILDQSPAGHMLIHDQAHRDNPAQEWAIRTLRDQLRGKLNPKTPIGPGIRTPRSASKKWLATQLGQALGRDLPTDPQ